MIHELKTWPQYYKPLSRGQKTFELRKYDRDFRVGDILKLREWDPDKEDYTGRDTERFITYILIGPVFGLQEGYCIMGIDL